MHAHTACFRRVPARQPDTSIKRLSVLQAGLAFPDAPYVYMSESALSILKLLMDSFENLSIGCRCDREKGWFIHEDARTAPGWTCSHIPVILCISQGMPCSYMQLYLNAAIQQPFIDFYAVKLFSFSPETSYASGTRTPCRLQLPFQRSSNVILGCPACRHAVRHTTHDIY
jgi:hypothetical protein